MRSSEPKGPDNQAVSYQAEGSKDWDAVTIQSKLLIAMICQLWIQDQSLLQSVRCK